MNSILANVIDTTCPKFNKDVTDGSVKKLLKSCPEYLDAIFKSGIKSLSPKVDMEYMGYRRLTPKEEYKYNFTGSTARNEYDIAISDLYMVEFVFRYGNDFIKKPIYLPYALDGNILRISNATYAIMPVLSDTVVSPSFNEVFVRLLKDKLSFMSFSYNIIINNERKPAHVVHTKIIRTSKMRLKAEIGNVETAASFYLLGEYGLKESFRKYVDSADKIKVVMGNVDKLRETHNVYESTKIKPKGLIDKIYNGHDVKICIDKSVPVTHFLENFITGIIYTLDILPEHASDFVELFNSGEVDKEIMYWRIMLGRIAYRNTFSVPTILMGINTHFNILQGYLDSLIKTKLEENGVYVDNFFDLMHYIIQNFNTWLLNSKSYNSDISNRYIDIYYYLLYEIIIGFNKVILNINKRVEKKTGNLEFKEVNKLFINDFGLKKIFNIVKSSQIALAIQSISDSSMDIKYPKITALLEDQSRGNGVKRASKATFPEATKTLKAQQLYIGSMLFLNKTAPSPVFKSNPYMKYNIYTGKLILDPILTARLDKLENMLTGRIENKKIEIIDNSDDTIDAITDMVADDIIEEDEVETQEEVE